MKNEIINQLGAKYKENDVNIIFLDNAMKHYSTVASHKSGFTPDNEKLQPYIKDAVVKAYERRGAEAMKNLSEGSMGYSFVDIEEELARAVRYIRGVL